MFSLSLSPTTLVSQMLPPAVRRGVVGFIAVLAFGAGDAGAQAARAAAPPDTLRFSVLMAGQPRGSQSVVTGGAVREIRFALNDRGRGSDLLERVTLDRRGRPVRVRITGVDYFKNPVDERFDQVGRRAAWRNSAEQGESRDSGGVYVSLNGAPGEIGLLAGALLEAPGRSLPLLPAGRAEIQTITQRRVRAEAESQPVTLYAIDGLDLTPTYLWLDSAGVLFSSGASWFMTIRAGWERVAPELLKAQDSVKTERGTELARRLTRKPRSLLAFTGVTLFEAEAATARPNMTVLIDGAASSQSDQGTA
jgi:hypothetical protein